MSRQLVIVHLTSCVPTVITLDIFVLLGWLGTTKRKCVTGNITYTATMDVQVIYLRTLVSIHTLSK